MFDLEIWTKSKTGFLVWSIICVFLGGIILLLLFPKISEVKTHVVTISPTPIVQEKIVYRDKIVYTENDRETWVRLIKLDDTIFGYAAEGIANLSLAITDISNGDLSNLPNYIATQKDISSRLNSAKMGRDNLLRQVGL